MSERKTPPLTTFTVPGDEMDPFPVAGNGLLDRRLFLRHGLAVSSISIGGIGVTDAAVEKRRASLAGAEFSNYGQPSVHEKDVIRWISANSDVPTNGVS